MGELWVILTNNTGGGYNLRMFYDRYSNGTLVAANQQDCLFSGTEILANTWVKVRAITWNWGDIIKVQNIFIDWTPGTPQSGTTCNFDLSKDPQKHLNVTQIQLGLPLQSPCFQNLILPVMGFAIPTSSLTIKPSVEPLHIIILIAGISMTITLPILTLPIPLITSQALASTQLI